MSMSINNSFFVAPPDPKECFEWIEKVVSNPVLSPSNRIIYSKQILKQADENGVWEMGRLSCSLGAYFASIDHDYREQADALIAQAEQQQCIEYIARALKNPKVSPTKRILNAKQLFAQAEGEGVWRESRLSPVFSSYIRSMNNDLRKQAEALIAHAANNCI